MKKFLVLVGVNFMVFCTIVLSVELAAQVLYFVRNGRLLLFDHAPMHSRLFEIHPYLAGRPRASVMVEQHGKKIAITPLHTRWTGGDIQDRKCIKIAVLGGSTTFCTGVTDKDSWPALLQQELGDGFTVINYGVPGYSTAENIIQMALLVPEQRPEFVVFFEGWNDISNYHEPGTGPDYYAHGIRQYSNLGLPVIGQQRGWQLAGSVLATVWLAEQIKKRMVRPKQQSVKLYDTPDPFVDRIYTRNLHTLKLLTERIGAKAIFIPQVLNYTKFPANKKSHWWTRHIRNRALPALMARFNERLLKVCSPGEENCMVLDGVLKQRWNSDDFVDEGHFSRKGNIKFARIVAHCIRSSLMTRHSGRVSP